MALEEQRWAEPGGRREWNDTKRPPEDVGVGP